MIFYPDAEETYELGKIPLHTENSVKNPLPSQMKIGDYFEKKDSWQVRYITSISGDSCGYKYYARDGYKVNRETHEIEGGWWVTKPCYNGFCTKAHIRSWSQK